MSSTMPFIQTTPRFRRCQRITNLSVTRNSVEIEPTVTRSKVLEKLVSSAFIITAFGNEVKAYPQPNYSYEGRGGPTYLTEPTPEFLDNEKKADVFRREQLAMKQEFKRVLDEFTSISYSGGKEDEETTKKLIASIEKLISLVKRQQGLPSGIQKESVYKLVRTKKKEGVWPTSVEYVYVNTLSFRSYIIFIDCVITFNGSFSFLQLSGFET